MSRTLIRCIRQYSQLQPDRFNALISQGLIEPIEAAESRLQPLGNLTYACKDNIVTKNSDTTDTAASHALYNYKSPFEATVVKLLAQAGATCIGKANLDEFGMGSANRNSYFGPVRNPFAPGTVPGGSSGGSGAAVAIPKDDGDVSGGGGGGGSGSAICDFALGTDTGGSVRLPGAYCNVFGFKPTYGRVSRWGVIAYAQTLDTVGVLARDVNTVRKVFDVLDLHDAKDPTSLPDDVRHTIEMEMETTTQRGKREKLVIGVPLQFIIKGLTPQVRQVWEDVLNRFVEMGHEIKTVSIASICKSLPAYYTLATSEAASNLARFDGTRYGYTARTPNANDHPMELIFENRTKSLGDEVQKRIILGNYTLSSDSAAYYMKANQVREKLTRELSSFFRNEHPLLKDGDSKQSDEKLCDLLIAPTAMSAPPTVEEYESSDKENILSGYINDVFTVPASLAGLPTISVPFNGVGIQLMGQFGDDRFVLDAAEMIKN
ncbi:uncharacterized protein LODBEIA_P54360 [Lodderomyces beijingensis]|uniref:Glutamyl-tRNA(Gln) amidotransferase subunit A, mitochondrial n=1 Tax=Lodderomyces beijingensis TaxID=1775926 RepID=A0ABP0ZV15_9ASCO